VARFYGPRCITRSNASALSPLRLVESVLISNARWTHFLKHWQC